jgi:hypothetical protein
MQKLPFSRQSNPATTTDVINLFGSLIFHPSAKFLPFSNEGKPSNPKFMVVIDNSTFALPGQLKAAAVAGDQGRAPQSSLVPIAKGKLFKSQDPRALKNLKELFDWPIEI